MEELKQQLMTRLANRTFKKNPGLLDRLALWLLARAAGPIEHDPELDHPAPSE